MLDNLATLRQMRDMREIYKSSYFKEHFVKRYINNISLLAYEMFGTDPTHQQIEIFQTHDFKGGRTVCPSGHGCHGIDTPILMFDGSIKMVQDVKVGDLLMGDDGATPRKVLKLARGQEELYEFTTNDGTTNIYNKSHKICLARTKSKGRYKTGDKIITTVGEWLKMSKSQQRVWAFYKGTIAGKSKKLPLDPYFFGVWLGDGDSKAPSITSIDQEIIDYLYRYSKEIHANIKVYSYENKTNRYTYTNNNGTQTIVSKKLHKLNVINNKHIPQEYKTASIYQRLQLLAGLLDTDGSLDHRNKSVFEITQKNKTLANDIVFIARSCGLHATIKEVEKYCYYKNVKRSNQYYRINITRNTDLVPTKIKRKQAIRSKGKNSRENLHFGVKNVEYVGVGDYYGFTVSDNNLFLDGNFITQSNTGKTRSIGVLASAFLLLFPQSITRIIAPQEKQVTNFSFKEIQYCLSSLKDPIKTGQGTFFKKWGFLFNFIKFTRRKIYIKGYDTSWYIEPATAPKGSPENVSGQHNFNYFLIFDEMSGIEDEIIANALGALTQTVNSCVGFSQHTKTTGKFHDFATSLSVNSGGVWDVIRMSSIESPLVGDKEIASWRDTYDDNEFNVKVLGLPPLYEDGFLISGSDADKLFSKRNKWWVDKLQMNNLVLSCDIAYTGLRDSSVNTVVYCAKVIDPLDGKEINYYVVDSIEVYVGKTKKRPTQMSSIMVNRAIECNNGSNTPLNTHLAIDATAGGDEAALTLQDLVTEDELSYEVIPIKWGSARLTGMDKQRYMNQRAKAYVLLKRAIEEDRVYCTHRCSRYRARVLQEVSTIPFEFTAQGLKYRIMDKKKMGKSPDIADTLAQMMLVNLYELREDVILDDEVFDVGDFGDDTDVDTVDDEFEEFEDELLVGSLIE